MPNNKFAIYINSDEGVLSSGFTIESRGFSCFELPAPLPKEDIENITAVLHKLTSNTDISTDLLQIETLEIAKKYHLTSLAVIVFAGKKALVSVSNAIVFLHRKSGFYKVVEGNQGSVGEAEENDLFMLVSQKAGESKKLGILTNILATSDPEIEPKEIVAQMKETALSEDGVVVIIKTPPANKSSHPHIEEKETFELPKTTLLQPKLPHLSLPKAGTLFKISILVIAIISIIKLIMVIGETVQAQKEKRFNTNLTSIEAAFNKLEQSGSLSSKIRAQKIEQIISDLNKLEAQRPDKKEALQLVFSKIEKYKSSYGDSQNSSADVFFDLDLIGKKTQIDRFETIGEKLVILDIKNKKVYSVSNTTKQNTSFSLKGLKDPTLATANEEQIYVFDRQRGIFLIDNVDSPKKIVDFDKEWGNIVDMKIFNNNIYLLDQKKDEVFKYSPVENGYSSKISYFSAGHSLDLQSAKSLSIDFSIFILTSSNLWKYTGGIRDSFVPQTNAITANIAQIYKTEDLEYIYLLDKKGSRIIVLNSKGKIIKSIFNDLVGKAINFGVYKDEQIFLGVGRKIYLLDNF